VSDFWCILEKSGAKNALFRRKTRAFLIKGMLLSSKSYALIEQKHSFYRLKALLLNGENGQFSVNFC